MNNLIEIKQKIEGVLDKMRPYLKIDGGDIKLVDVTEDGVVRVELLGACNGCAMSPMTLRAGIERAIMFDVPEIKRIECVNM
jgi:Fe-S cluster biogenesis protein NfuA